MKRNLSLAMAIPALGLIALSATPSSAMGSGTPKEASVKAQDLKAYPAATRGQTRHVIALPQQRDEDSLKVELIVGKTIEIDCNNHAFGGKLEERTAQGWGYTYFVLEKLGPGRSTMMGCASQAKRTAFVRSSDQQLVRYNSKLPLVVYAPADVEVRYRIWRAGTEQRAPN